MTATEVGFWKKTWKEKVIFIAVTAMAIGQWSDTKAMLTDAYVGVVSNFTHVYEYKSLNLINVGSNLDYIEQEFGSPQLTKTSTFDKSLHFNYYLHEKYILTLMHRDNRIQAYSVISLVSDFTPNDLLTKNPIIGKETLSQYYNDITEFTLDYNNVSFVIVKEELSKEALFLNKYYGSIEYDIDVNLDQTELRLAYNYINGVNYDDVAEFNFKPVSEKGINNLYGVGEVELSTVADSILTRFEYYLYYKNKKVKV